MQLVALPIVSPLQAPCLGKWGRREGPEPTQSALSLPLTPSYLRSEIYFEKNNANTFIANIIGTGKRVCL